MRDHLTKASAASAKGEAKRYELRDKQVPGLRLVVQPRPSTVRTWVLRYTNKAGDYRKWTIGNYSDKLGLEKAREIASNQKLRVVTGADPGAEKAEARRMAAAGIDPDQLFSTAWAEWIKAPKPKARDSKGWRASTAARVAKLYANELEPRWGKRRLRDIVRSDVEAYIEPIAKEHPQGAARRLRVLASFFNWCVKKGRIDKSPCDEVEKAKGKKRRRKLSDDELRWLWKACDKAPYPFGHIVRLIILTLARRTEVAGLRDLELHRGNRPVWILPPARAKNNHEHRIVLTGAMIDVIDAIPRVKSKDGWLFTTNGETHFSGYSKAKKQLDEIMLAVAQEEDPKVRVIPNWTLHDLRRTAASRMQRLADDDVVDACLNHFDDDEYLQDDFEEKKEKAFLAWSCEVERIVSL